MRLAPLASAERRGTGTGRGTRHTPRECARGRASAAAGLHEVRHRAAERVAALGASPLPLAHRSHRGSPCASERAFRCRRATGATSAAPGSPSVSAAASCFSTSAKAGSCGAGPVTTIAVNSVTFTPLLQRASTPPVLNSLTPQRPEAGSGSDDCYNSIARSGRSRCSDS